MNVFAWLIFCLLASVGIVQAIGWLMGYMWRPSKNGGVYHVVRLQRDPELLEAQLRYELFLLRWSSGLRPDLTVLLDTGLGKEARDICRNMLAGVRGIVVCFPEELPELISQIAEA